MCSGRWVRRSLWKRQRQCSPGQGGNGVTRRGPKAVTTSANWLTPNLTVPEKLDAAIRRLIAPG